MGDRKLSNGGTLSDSSDEWRMKDTESGSSENETFSFGPLDVSRTTDTDKSDEDDSQDEKNPRQTSAKFLQYASRYKGFSPETHRELVKERYNSFSQNRETKKIKQNAHAKLRDLTPREFNLLREAHKAKVREANNELRRRQKAEISKKKRQTIGPTTVTRLKRSKSEQSMKNQEVRKTPTLKTALSMADTEFGNDSDSSASSPRAGRSDTGGLEALEKLSKKEKRELEKKEKREKKEQEKREKKEKKEREKEEKERKAREKKEKGKDGKEDKDENGDGEDDEGEGKSDKEDKTDGKDDGEGSSDSEKNSKAKPDPKGEKEANSESDEKPRKGSKSSKSYSSSDESKKKPSGRKNSKDIKESDIKPEGAPPAAPKFNVEEHLQNLYSLCAYVDKEVTYEMKLHFLDEVLKEYEEEKQAMKAKNKSGSKGRGSTLWEESSVIFHKPLTSLSCHQDFARLARNWQLARKVGIKRTVLCGPFKATVSKTECAATLLITLANTVGEEETAKQIDKNFGKYITCDEDLLDPTGLKSMFSELIGETNIVVSVLKATTQGIVAPAITKFKEALEPLTFNSTRGGWGISITVGEEEITVLHKKKEKNSPEAEERYGPFTFEWAIEYIFDVNMIELKYVRPFLLSVKGGAKMKKILTKSFKNFADAK